MSVRQFIGALLLGVLGAFAIALMVGLFIRNPIGASVGVVLGLLPAAALYLMFGGEDR